MSVSTTHRVACLLSMTVLPCRTSTQNSRAQKHRLQNTLGPLTAGQTIGRVLSPSLACKAHSLLYRHACKWQCNCCASHSCVAEHFSMPTMCKTAHASHGNSAMGAPLRTTVRYAIRPPQAQPRGGGLLRTWRRRPVQAPAGPRCRSGWGPAGSSRLP